MAGFRVEPGGKEMPAKGAATRPTALPATPFSRPTSPPAPEAAEVHGELLRQHNPALEFLKDADGRLVYYNRAFESVFAPDGRSLVGKLDTE
ncbi:MAG: hypothetical protein M3R34_08100, partial [Acidobacteriota bacterium]|nr:hypothetical protein [Acidobacteriota bacterium]